VFHGVSNDFTAVRIGVVADATLLCDKVAHVSLHLAGKLFVSFSAHVEYSLSS